MSPNLLPCDKGKISFLGFWLWRA